MRAELVASHLSGDGELITLAAEWRDLWARSRATPFQSPAWLIPWWHHFHPGELFVVTIRHAQRLVGLAPFYIEVGALGRRILPIGISLSDYLDVMIDPEYRESAARALVTYVAEHGSRW